MTENDKIMGSIHRVNGDRCLLNDKKWALGKRCASLPWDTAIAERLLRKNKVKSPLQVTALLGWMG